MSAGGSARWASTGMRRKSKGVEDLYTSRARDAPQKKLWVSVSFGDVARSSLFVLVYVLLHK